MEFLVSLGAMLGVNEASRLLDEVFLSDERNVRRVVNSIIQAASRKGQAELLKAQHAIENIPMLAGSTSIQSMLREARANAQKNLLNVESKVAEMDNDAQLLQQEVERNNNRSFLGKVIDRAKGRDYSKEASHTFANKYGIDYNAVENSVKGENK